jgi:hypothetical protein
MGFSFDNRLVFERLVIVVNGGRDGGGFSSLGQAKSGGILE